MSKKVIYTDLNAYQVALDKQTKMQNCIDAIVKEASKIDVEINDFRFIEKTDPLTLIKDAYWKANKFPAGVTMEKALSHTEFNTQVVEDAYKTYQLLSKTVKPLTIREDSVEITVKESDYDWYLNEDKKDLHTALEKFIKASEELKKYTDVNFYTIQKAINFNNVLIDNGNLVVNVHTFKA